MNKIPSLLIVAVLFLVVGCAPQNAPSAEPSAMFDVVGEWDYTMTNSDGNNYDDGTIKFTGTATQGEWTLVNFYEVEYTGSYTVSGDGISLTGDETWQGRFVDGSHISGTWQKDDANGTWSAVRK
jgi:hypothetical protein